MNVTVIGKEFVRGTSRKTGEPFASNLVHVTHKKIGCDGLAAESIWLRPEDVPMDSIEVGKVYTVDRDSRGRIIEFYLAK